MNSKQRKTHLLIWLLLAVAVPIFMFFTIKSLDFSPEEDKITYRSKVNSAIKKSAENDMLEIVLTKYNTITVYLKSPIKHPSSLVYELTDNNSRGKLIGQINNAVIAHSFEIENSIIGIVLYDPIKEIEITKLKF